MLNRPPGTGGGASQWHLNQSSPPSKCTSHLGFSLEGPHPAGNHGVAAHGDGNIAALGVVNRCGHVASWSCRLPVASGQGWVRWGHFSKYAALDDCPAVLRPGPFDCPLMSLRGAKRRGNLDPVAGFSSLTRLPRCARNDISDNRMTLVLRPCTFHHPRPILQCSPNDRSW